MSYRNSRLVALRTVTALIDNLKASRILTRCSKPLVPIGLKRHSKGPNENLKIILP